MVVYTVTYSFSNIESNYNSTNYSTGTTHMNDITANKIIANSITGNNYGLTINNLLTLTSGIYLQTVYPTLPTSYMLGWSSTTTSANSSPTTNTFKNLMSNAIPAGVYMVSGFFGVNQTGGSVLNINRMVFEFSTSTSTWMGSGSMQQYSNAITIPVGYSNMYSSSSVYSSTQGFNICANCLIAYTGTVVMNATMTITKIA